MSLKEELLLKNFGDDEWWEDLWQNDLDRDDIVWKTRDLCESKINSAVREFAEIVDSYANQSYEHGTVSKEHMIKFINETFGDFSK